MGEVETSVIEKGEGGCVIMVVLRDWDCRPGGGGEGEGEDWVVVALPTDRWEGVQLRAVCRSISSGRLSPSPGTQIWLNCFVNASKTARVSCGATTLRIQIRVKSKTHMQKHEMVTVMLGM